MPREYGSHPISASLRSARFAADFAGAFVKGWAGIVAKEFVNDFARKLARAFTRIGNSLITVDASSFDVTLGRFYEASDDRIRPAVCHQLRGYLPDRVRQSRRLPCLLSVSLDIEGTFALDFKESPSVTNQPLIPLMPSFQTDMSEAEANRTGNLSEMVAVMAGEAWIGITR